MASTMKALVKHARAEGARLEQVPVPSPKAGEVLVKVTATAICGTDVHIYQWNKWAQGRIKPPLVFGHEFCGEVVELGEGVDDIALGTRVSAEGHFVCGTCYFCRTGQAHICQDVEIIGVDTDGCFAEYVRVPRGNLWVLDPEVPTEVAAIHDPFGNAVHTALADSLVGNTVLITGCGPIGLIAIAVAKKAGASRVFASDLNDYRLDLARKMGADSVYKVGRDDMVAGVLEETRGLGADVLLEMAGHPSSINDGLRALRKGGWASLLGLPDGPVEIDLADQVIFKGAKIYGINGRRMYDTWYMMQALLRGGLDLTPLITHRFKFEEFEKAFDLAISGNSGKIILYP
jgi:threonine 3-dehydrogenase